MQETSCRQEDVGVKGPHVSCGQEVAAEQWA